MSNDCLFCNLLADGKFNLLYEDTLAVAFVDVEPKAPVHIIIIPRQHIASVNEVEETDEAVLGHLFSVAKTIAQQKNVNNSGYRLSVNTESDAGQTVHHLHIHLLAGGKLGHMNSE